ncbi:MAG: DUF167 domain-containing protein [Candidatus Sumerlaeota bacterium]|nr:DUF167 domain-containing protein [Candidatus Sumerlaeota bacterium]
MPVNNIGKKGDEGIVIKVRVTPRSSRTEFAGASPDGFRLKVKAPPVEGAANDECIKFLARTFGVAKGAVSLKTGGKSRKKIFEISGCTETEAIKVIQSLNLKEVKDERTETKD